MYKGCSYNLFPVCACARRAGLGKWKMTEWAWQGAKVRPTVHRDGNKNRANSYYKSRALGRISHKKYKNSEMNRSLRNVQCDSDKGFYVIPGRFLASCDAKSIYHVSL